MSTLLLRLAGPLQSWGIDSKFEIRRTEREPSKSGIVGLLAAALGRKRDASVEDLTRLRFGVRVDQEGSLMTDFHMVRKDTKTSYLTRRTYLEDAVFLVGLESEDESLLQTLEEALHSPAFPLFLGRRSCPPTLPLCLGIRPVGLSEALEQEPWQAAAWRQKRLSPKLRCLTDRSSEERGTAVRRDLPLSFHPAGRSYGWRPVANPGYVDLTADSSDRDTEHDPMQELEG